MKNPKENIFVFVYLIQTDCKYPDEKNFFFPEIKQRSFFFVYCCGKLEVTDYTFHFKLLFRYKKATRL